MASDSKQMCNPPQDVAQADLGQEFLVVTTQEEGPANWVRHCDADQQPVCDFDLVSGSATGEVPLPCERCPLSLSPWRDRVCVRRTCTRCGKLQYEASHDPSTGPLVRKGEQIVLPKSLLERNLRLTGGASFSRRGVDWLAAQLFLGPVVTSHDLGELQKGLRRMAGVSEEVLKRSEILSGLDLSTEEGVARAQKVALENRGDPAYAALMLHAHATLAADALSGEADPSRLSSAVAYAWSAGALNALFKFKIAFEDAAYLGNSIERLRWMISEWSKNQSNGSEAYWQKLLFSHPFALSQLFAAPVVVHGQSFLVGGVRAGGKRGKIADYLLRNQLTDAAVIVELKTPTTKLLGRQYRNDVFAPSQDLSGAIQQVLEQRAQFMKDMKTHQSELEIGEPRVEVVEPHCVVVVGHAAAELDTRARRRSFETYRGELRTVKVVTFDELFAKLSGLVSLLGAEVR